MLESALVQLCTHVLHLSCSLELTAWGLGVQGSGLVLGVGSLMFRILGAGVEVKGLECLGFDDV